LLDEKTKFSAAPDKGEPLHIRIAIDTLATLLPVSGAE
jgi:hypothetical protein